MASGLKVNEEFGFLYKKCKKIKPYIISRIAYIPEFMDAIREADQDGILWCEQTIYDVLRIKYLKMIKDGCGSKHATDIMNKISKAVTGDIHTWRNS